MLLVVLRGNTTPSPPHKHNHTDGFQWSHSHLKEAVAAPQLQLSHSVLPASKLQTQFKATAKAFKIQVTGRRKQGEKKLKVLIKCSLGQP